MIFNVMENKEELLFALKELREGEVSDISSNLEQYILHVSKTGETMFAWPLIQPLLTQKLRRVSDDFYAEMPTDQLPSRPNTENVQFHELQSRVVEHINRFSGTPFTIQRLCELLVNPRSHYTRPDKFLRGIEKIVMVVSTVEAMKVANGSTTSVASDEEPSEAEKTPASALNGVWCSPPSPNAKLSPNRPASPALDLTDRPDRPGPLSPTHPLSTAPKAAHALPEPELSASSLRPMGQLEAFVQNVSQRLTNQICSPAHNGSSKEERTEEKAEPGTRLASLVPEEGEKEGSRKREIEPKDDAETEDGEEEEEAQGRPAKVPRLSDWESPEKEETDKAEGDEKEIHRNEESSANALEEQMEEGPTEMEAHKEQKKEEEASEEAAVVEKEKKKNDDDDKEEEEDEEGTKNREEDAKDKDDAKALETAPEGETPDSGPEAAVPPEEEPN